MTSGRSTDSRTVSLTFTSGSTTVTAAAGTFTDADLGRRVYAARYLPNTGAVIVSVTNDMTAVMSAAATASGTAASAGVGVEPAGNQGFTGWVPESTAQEADWTVASVGGGGVPPDVLADDVTRVVQPTAPGN